MTKTIRPAPDGRGTYAETGGDNTFDGIQTADAFTTPLPSTKGAPDTQALRSSTNVPIIEYAPEGITCGIYRPVISQRVDKTASYTILDTEAYNFIFGNSGASGSVTLTTPTAKVGMGLSFFQDSNANDLVVSGNIINSAGATVASLTANAVNEHLMLHCFKAGIWSAVSTVGTWI